MIPASESKNRNTLVAKNSVLADALERIQCLRPFSSSFFKYKITLSLKL